ncbi:MAG: hypothetical protein JXA30_00460 [Deltaproteobacteria bacterium]|nr:hypothetical protein [Deltaproteobacteria bacterium]
MDNLENLSRDRSSNQALFVFLEGFISRRKLLCISDKLVDADGILKNASSVEWLVADKTPASIEPEGIHVTALLSGRLPFEDGAFDVVVVPDLASLDFDPEALIAELHRVVDARGLVVVGIVNNDRLNVGEISAFRNDENELRYQAVYRLLAERFTAVSLMRQTPLFGYSLVDFAAAEELVEISFDASLIDPVREVPTRFVALCSGERLAIDPYTVVRVAPLSADLLSVEPQTDSSSTDQDEYSARTREVERMEEALRTCGDELRELRTEMDRRNALMRDLVEQTRSDAEALKRVTSERDRAVARAVEAEAGRFEAALRLDEACGHLKLAGLSPEKVHCSVEAESASLSGRVRGMQSRIAELEEAREMTEARLVLKEYELQNAQERALSLERRLEEIKERFELEISRTTLSTSVEDASGPNQENEELRARCDELSKRLADVEKSLADACDETRIIQIEAADLKKENTALRASVEALQLSETRLESALSESEQTLGSEQRKSNQVIAEKYQSDSKLVDVKNELNERQLQVQLLQERLDSLIDEKRRLGDELHTTRSEAETRMSSAQERIRHLVDALRDVRETLQRLSEILANPDRGDEKPFDSQQVDLMEDSGITSSES